MDGECEPCPPPSDRHKVREADGCDCGSTIEAFGRCSRSFIPQQFQPRLDAEGWRRSVDGNSRAITISGDAGQKAQPLPIDHART